MKKTLAFLLTFVLVFSLFSLSALAADKPLIKVWIPVYQFGDGISDQDFWDGQFDAFEKANNCEVKVDIIPWGDYNTTIYTGLINNDGPDVLYVTDTYDIVKADLLLGLDSYFTEDEKKEHLYWNLAPKTANGETATIPQNGGCVFMFYNKDILKEAGIEEVPVEWDAFLQACKTIEEKTGKKSFLQNWGASTGTSALMTSFWPYYFQAGGTMLDENGNIQINNEAGLKTLEFIKSFYDNGIFDESITAESTAVDQFAANELAFTCVGDGKNSTFTKNNVNWGYIFSLKGEKGYGSRAAADAYAVSKKSKERGTDKLAAEALKLICSGPVMDSFHKDVFAFPVSNINSTYIANETFDKTYREHQSAMFIVSEFEGKASFEKALQSNIQMMFMGDFTPQEVLEETMAYYNDQIKQ